jgi:hypothetical protein
MSRNDEAMRSISAAIGHLKDAVSPDQTLRAINALANAARGQSVDTDSLKTARALLRPYADAYRDAGEALLVLGISFEDEFSEKERAEYLRKQER